MKLLHPQGPKIKKIREISSEIWKFRARMKLSSEPPTAALFFCGDIETFEIEIFERDQKFRSRSKISIEIKFFLIVGPSGHIKLFPVAPVTGPGGRVSGQKDLCSLRSEDIHKTLTPGLPVGSARILMTRRADTHPFRGLFFEGFFFNAFLFKS